MPRVDVGFMVNLPIPVPPIQEQDRIVKVFKGIRKKFICLNKNQKNYTMDPKILTPRLMDAGIQANLPNHFSKKGMAKNLYEKIQAKKPNLVKGGKIKKEKPLPELPKKAKPFTFPSN